ncbi:MAG: hypothetical protein KBD16_03165 [Candidatus Pacebacteria bacterium]|nr:hypothetical protein [Candidatus Paceibacterota bacterium]
MAKLTRSALNERVTSLEEELKSTKTLHDLEISQKDVELETNTKKYENEVKELRNELEGKQQQLNQKELKRLASAYELQEGDFNIEAEKWFKFVMAALILLLGSIIFSTLFAQGELWYERFEYYLADFVFVTFLILSLKQYSSSNRLRIDFANRKTVAQSYHNILSSTEDLVIKEEFLKKATDVLCAPSRVESESYTVPEKVLETLSEAVKLLSRK